MNNSHIINLPEVDCIIFRPRDDEPGIIYWSSDGKTRTEVFADDWECDTAWASIEESIEEEDFMHFYNIRFRPGSLKALNKSHTPESGHYLQFIFHGHESHRFKQPYADEKTLDSDLGQLTDILTELQDTRAGRNAPATIQ